MIRPCVYRFFPLLLLLLVGFQTSAFAQLKTQEPAELLGQLFPEVEELKLSGDKKVQLIQIVQLSNPKLKAFFDTTKAFVESEGSGLNPKDYSFDVIALDSPEAVAAFGLSLGESTVIHSDPEAQILAKVINHERLSIPFTLILNEKREILYTFRGFRSGREIEFVRVMRAVAQNTPEVIQEINAPLTSPPPGKRVGKKAPGVVISKWMQNPQTPDQEKFKFVEFWATWCGPCIQMFPHVQESYETYGDKVQFMSLSDEPEEVVAKFLEKVDYTFPIGIYDESSIIPSRTIPYAFLVNPDGIVVWEGHPAEFARNKTLLQSYIDQYQKAEKEQNAPES